MVAVVLQYNSGVRGQGSAASSSQRPNRISTWTRNGTKASSQSAIGGDSMDNRLAGELPGQLVGGLQRDLRPPFALLANTVLEGNMRVDAVNRRSLSGHQRLHPNPWDPNSPEWLFLYIPTPGSSSERGCDR